MGDYCSELCTAGGGYFVVIGDLFVIESYWLAGGNALFLSEHLGNEHEETSSVLNALVHLVCVVSVGNKVPPKLLGSTE